MKAIVHDRYGSFDLLGLREIDTPSVGDEDVLMLIRLFKPLVLSPFVNHDPRRFLSVTSHEDLVVLKKLVETGRLEPDIDRRYALEETGEALAYIETGHSRGKVVVSI